MRIQQAVMRVRRPIRHKPWEVGYVELELSADITKTEDVRSAVTELQEDLFIQIDRLSSQEITEYAKQKGASDAA